MKRIISVMAMMAAMVAVMAMPALANGPTDCKPYGQAVAPFAQGANSPQDPAFGEFHSDVAQGDDGQPGLGHLVQQQLPAYCR